MKCEIELRLRPGRVLKREFELRTEVFKCQLDLRTEVLKCQIELRSFEM